MREEIFRDIKGYEGIYQVGDKGNVRSLLDNHKNKRKEPKLLKQNLKKTGYYEVCLCKEQVREWLLVHRLVYAAFIGEIPDGMVVNHKSEIKTENFVENLELLTPKENSNYGTRNQRIGQKVAITNKVALKGNTNGRKQLTLRSKEFGGTYTFSCEYEASKFFGYKTVRGIGTIIHRARKTSSKTVIIKGEEFYYTLSK